MAGNDRDDELAFEEQIEFSDSAPEELIAHVRSPRNLGVFECPDGYASITGPCGDSVEVSIAIDEGRIARVGHVPSGCAFTLACASVATTIAKGRTLAEARSAVSPMAIDAALGGLPEDHAHCARLAASAVWGAIDDAIATAREPWRRAYRS